MRPDNESVDRDARVALKGAAEPLDDDARARIRARVMTEARSSRKRTPVATLARHRFAVAATAFALLSGGTAYAANESLPGDPLYALKRAGENALVAIVPPSRIEQRLLVGLAVRRAEEVAALARRGETAGMVDASLEELRDAMRRAAPPEGSLSEQDRERIREHAEDAPDPTRTQINDAIGTSSGSSGTGGQNPTPPAGSGSGGASSGSGTTDGGGTPAESGSGTGDGAGAGGTGGPSGQGPQGSGSGSGPGH